jgi:hypothetical protein
MRAGKWEFSAEQGEKAATRRSGGHVSELNISPAYNLQTICSVVIRSRQKREARLNVGRNRRLMTAPLNIRGRYVNYGKNK